MILVYRDENDLFSEWNHNEGLLLLPSNSVFKFIASKLTKFGVVKLDDGILSDIEKKRNINILDYDIDKDLYARPNKENLEYLFSRTKRDVEKGKDIYTKPDAFSLFLEWAKENFPDFDEEVYLNVEDYEVYDAYAKEKNPTIRPFSLERLVKLFSIFYTKNLEKEEIKILSRFQFSLLDLNLDESFFLIPKVREIILKIFEKEKERLTTSNIFNKILELLDNLENLKDDQYLIEENILYPSKEKKEKSVEYFKKEVLV